MNNFLLKTQINDNPPQLWTLQELFDINSDAEVKKNLNYLMQAHFARRRGEPFDISDINLGDFRYYVGERVFFETGTVWQCFTRKSVKAYLANNLRPSAEVKNLVLATPDDKFNNFLAQYNLSVPAFDKPTGYRDTLKILRTTADDTVHLSNDVQFIDAFDFLKEHLENHVSELDNSGFSIANATDCAIIFTAEAMIVESTLSER